MHFARNNSDGKSENERSTHSPDRALEDVHRLSFASSASSDIGRNFPADDSAIGEMGRARRKRAYGGEFRSIKTSTEFFRESICETTNSAATRKQSERCASAGISESVLLLRQQSTPVQKLPEEGALLQRMQEEGPSRAHVHQGKSTGARHGAEGDC